MIAPAALTAAGDLAAWGLPGVFLAAFLAGSIFPLPSEAALAAVIASGQGAALTVAVATAGNLLGAATLFWAARAVARAQAGRVQRWLEQRTVAQRARAQRAHAWVHRWGALALLLSWLPFLGDALVLAAGAAGVGWLPFAIFTALGKGLRYALVAASTVAALSVAG